MEDTEFNEKFSDDSENDEFGDDSEQITFSKNDIDLNEFYKNYDITKFKTPPILSKYEKTRIISERVQQLSNGGVPFISNPEIYNNVYDIAIKELNMNKLPFIIKRSINSENVELWKIEDLKVIN